MLRVHTSYTLACRAAPQSNVDAMSQDVLISPDTGTSRYRLPIVASSMVADVLVVLVFVVAGRATHDESMAVGGVLDTAWPFLVGVAGGWLGIFLGRMQPWSMPAAGMMIFKTVVLGLVLRSVVQAETTAVSFALTTAVILGVLFVAWRVAARGLTRARS